MPIYEYECIKCHEVHEVIQEISEEPLKNCPVCRGELKRLISQSSFILKGSGWYVTDYAKKKKLRGFFQCKQNFQKLRRKIHIDEKNTYSYTI